jgi:PAS domain S-box-containing protein
LKNAESEIKSGAPQSTAAWHDIGLIANSLPALISYVDCDMHYRFVNDAYEKLLGMKREDIIGARVQDILSETAFKTIEPHLRLALTGCREGVAVEVNVRDESRQWLSAIYSPDFDSFGFVRGVSVLAIDVTDRKKIEEEQKSQRQRSEYLSEVSSVLNSSLNAKEILDGLVRLSVPTISDYCSFRRYEGGYLKLLSLAHAQPEKTALTWEKERLYPVDPNNEKSSLYRAIRTQKSELVSQVLDSRLERGVKDPRHLELKKLIDIGSYMCVPIVVRGRSYGVLTFVNCRTSRQFNQMDLNFAEEIAKRGALAIDNSQLYDESQAINRVKDEFLATLSHELRTPLNVIAGYSELLSNEFDSMKSEEIKQAIDAIARNARLQTEMIADLLDVSKIITGKIAFRPQKISIQEIIKAVTDNFSITADAKGLSLNVETKGVPKFIYGDPVRLQQVIWNLVSNALKFTPKGGQIHVSAERDGDNCVIQVQDSGVGIDPEFLPYVFDRFRQEDSSITKRFGGLGLGLSISRQLIEVHGGTIRAESAGKNFGTRFTVTLPVKMDLHEEATRQQEKTHAMAPVALSAKNLMGIKILLIEDSVDSRELLHRLLTKLGLVVKDADSASEARGILKNFTPDLIISDIGMPQESGIEFIQRLRTSRDKKIRDLPAIALTAYVRSEERDEALRSGFQKHLAKPVVKEALTDAISDLIGPSQLDLHPPTLSDAQILQSPFSSL